METLKKYFLNLPIGICGTGVALITLSNCWNLKGIAFLKPLTLIFAGIILMLQGIRLIVCPKEMKEELLHPMTGSFYPTIDMLAFLVAGTIFEYIPFLGRAVWVAAFVLHISIIIIFFYKRTTTKSFDQVIPSWFIVNIGIVVGAVVSPGMGFDVVAKGMVIFGILSYVVMWPIMLYKVFGVGLSDKEAPVVGIMAAPASLCLVGYLTVFSTYNRFLVIFLVVTGFFNLLLVYSRMPRLFKEGFRPTFASFTFPLAISIMAMYKLGAIVPFGEAFNLVGDIELFIGTAVIFYVAYKLTKGFLEPIHLHLQHK